LHLLAAATTAPPDGHQNLEWLSCPKTNSNDRQSLCTTSMCILNIFPSEWFLTYFDHVSASTM
jgi:hypothetical protein